PAEALARKPILEQRIDREIGLGDRRVSVLEPALERRLERFEGELSRFADRLDDMPCNRAALARFRRLQRSSPPLARSGHWCRNGKRDRWQVRACGRCP